MENQDRIKQTKIEDFIFLVYYIIITLSLYANVIERRYLIYKNHADREKYRYLLLIIFIIATIIYFYNVISSYDDFKDSDGYNKCLNKLSLIASILILISGVIYVYIIYQDREIGVEIAFT